MLLPVTAPTLPSASPGHNTPSTANKYQICNYGNAVAVNNVATLQVLPNGGCAKSTTSPGATDWFQTLTNYTQNLANVNWDLIATSGSIYSTDGIVIAFGGGTFTFPAPAANGFVYPGENGGAGSDCVLIYNSGISAENVSGSASGSIPGGQMAIYCAYNATLWEGSNSGGRHYDQRAHRSGKRRRGTWGDLNGPLR